MFGDYVVYCCDKPIFFVCDNTVFIKDLPEINEIIRNYCDAYEKGYPYDGAKEHIVLDIDNAELATDIAITLSKILPIPKSAMAKKRRLKAP
jgi:TfoX/Sxy family transcriptional regulator of competence genes